MAREKVLTLTGECPACDKMTLKIVTGRDENGHGYAFYSCECGHADADAYFPEGLDSQEAIQAREKQDTADYHRIYGDDNENVFDE